MLFNVQHADPQADPHDAIAAQLRDLAPRVADHSAVPSIAPTATPESPREPSFQTEPLNDNVGDILDPPRRKGIRWSMLLATVCAGAVVAAAWHLYGDAAKQQLSVLIPQLRPAALVPAQTTPEPQDSTTQAASKTTAQDAPSASTEPAPAQAAAVTSAPAPLSPEIAQSIETMKQEIASLKQTIEQLQTSQQQLGRDVSKLNEQDTRRKASAQAARPVPKPQIQRMPSSPVVPYRAPAPYPPQVSSPASTYSHATTQRETHIAPAAPAQLPPQPGDTSVPRPPMPLQ